MRFFEALPPRGSGGALRISWTQNSPGSRIHADERRPRGNPATLKLIDRRGTRADSDVAMSADLWASARLSSRLEDPPAGEYAILVPATYQVAYATHRFRRAVDGGLEYVSSRYQTLNTAGGSSSRIVVQPGQQTIRLDLPLSYREHEISVTVATSRRDEQSPYFNAHRATLDTSPYSPNRVRYSSFDIPSIGPIRLFSRLMINGFASISMTTL